MEEQKYKDAELKANIFTTYTEYHNPSSDQYKSLFQLWILVCEWCKNHLFSKEKHILYEDQEEFEMGLYYAVRRCAIKEKMSKEIFSPYLYTALVNAKNQYIRDLEDNSLVNTRTSKKIRGYRKMLESNLGRKSTDDELFSYICKVMPQLKKETVRDYLEAIDIKVVSNIINDNDGNDLNIFDTIKSHHLTPEEEAMADDSIADIIKVEFEKYLNKQQDRTKRFYRAIYTLYCIKKSKKDCQMIRSILDEEILETYEKGEELPTQAEIYSKYHTGEKSTAQTNASVMKTQFIEGFEEVLKKAIKEKHPNIIF